MPENIRSIASPIARALVVLTLLCLASTASTAGEASGLPGRFVYANDDDWDWATPSGSATRSLLSRYGVMEWSALDWIEEGLPEVRGVLVGSWPNSPSVTGADLTALRQGVGGAERSYASGGNMTEDISRFVAEPAGPNVLVLMSNTADDFHPAWTPEVLDSLVEFVRRGGRLAIFDDWGKFIPVVERFVTLAPVTPPRELSEEDEARFSDLVLRLGAESFDEREAATAALIEMGPAVLPLLGDVASEDPEVTSRIAGIRDALAPPPPRGSASSSSPPNDAFAGYLERARASDPGATLASISRDAQHDSGYALMVRVR